MQRMISIIRRIDGYSIMDAVKRYFQTVGKGSSLDASTPFKKLRNVISALENPELDSSSDPLAIDLLHSLFDNLTLRSVQDPGVNYVVCRGIEKPSIPGGQIQDTESLRVIPGRSEFGI